VVGKRARVAIRRTLSRERARRNFVRSRDAYLRTLKTTWMMNMVKKGTLETDSIMGNGKKDSRSKSIKESNTLIHQWTSSS
jgi:hypothetical protein